MTAIEDTAFIWGPSNTDTDKVANVRINDSTNTWVFIPEKELRRICRLSKRDLDYLFHIKK